MNKYSEIEIQTAKRLYDAGYKWIVRYENGDVDAFSENPNKKGIFWLGTGSVKIVPVSGRFTPLFQSIKWEDNEPTYIEDIISPQILDDAEKKYLSAVIKPFRDKVNFICKVNFNTPEGYGFQHIFIGLTDASADVVLPLFKSGTMYKGMKLGHPYTLEELGL